MTGAATGNEFPAARDRPSRLRAGRVWRGRGAAAARQGAALTARA